MRLNKLRRTSAREGVLDIQWIDDSLCFLTNEDHQFKKLAVLKQILLVSTLGNVLETVWRICILMLGCKGSAFVRKKIEIKEIARVTSATFFSYFIFNILTVLLALLECS